MLKHVLAVFGLIVLVAIGIFVWLAWPDQAKLDVNAVAGARPDITAPRQQVIPTVGTADPIGWKNGERPIVAAGLRVQPFATGLDHPRWLYRLPNGDVLVAETNSPPREGGGIKNWVMKTLLGRVGAGVPSANRITLLRDANGDGVAELKTPFMTGLNSPSGMVLFEGQLYVANTDSLVRVPYTAGETKITAKPELVIRYPGGGNHWARNVIASEDGRTLYLSVGSSSNVAENGLDQERNRAAILQVFPKEKTFRIYAAGLRNANGMALNPDTRALWTVVNERDMLGSDLAPDYLTAVEFGDHFGWPWYYWGGYPDPRVEPKNPELQQYSKRPDYALGPHVAALGLSFANDVRLGDRFARGTFVGEHGSWNRKPLSGYKIVFVPFTPRGWPVKGAKPIDVLTGFVNADGEAHGRPVDVKADARGGLLVADDVGNTIWRVSGNQPVVAAAR
ncbi:sorbosone dehydrogenase family protein [Sphingomonas sp. HHU CXW]|uniref:Sorbosone dehydrogenase family protein n=1 Tax=Sphingomonas hominis TaxID=2741495 RepID=A0ABX2JHN5_9SPHN|nr:sorbosone dehydrogenase family protein [Sphingomonas hominis]NTS63932.1 sorbosone dehydrogenase family protein [Sphingomonas hominis]